MTVIMDHHPPARCLVWPFTDEHKVGTVPIAVSAARTHTAEILTEWGMTDRFADAARLIVSELVTNAINASWPIDASESISLWLSADTDSLLIEVWDGSPDMPSPRPGDDEGGRGLAIVAALSQGWGVYSDRHGKIVWALLCRSRSSLRS